MCVCMCVCVCVCVCVYVCVCNDIVVTQLDARPTGDQEVVGSTPAGSATFCRGD